MRHFRMPAPLALRIRGSIKVLQVHFIECTDLIQSSSLGSCTLAVKNAMDVQVSGLAHLVVHKVFATVL